MRSFHFPFPTRHSPEELWEAMTTPLPPELNYSVNSPRVDLAYEGLSEEGRINEGTRLIYTPNSPAIDFVYRQLLRFAPDEGTSVVDTISGSSKTRVDVIEPGQVAKGHMEYRVKDGKDETGILVVEGEFAIEGMAEVIAKVWPVHLGDINEWLVTHGIERPARRMAQQVPDVLAATQAIQYN